MLIFLWLILILCGIMFPKSKTISFLMLAFMIIVIGFRTQGADYIVYQNEYKWSEYQTFSDVHYVGYFVVEQFAHRLNLSFEQFLLFVGVISIVLTYSGLRKMTKNVNLLLALYFIYPFTHEAIQTRTFIANSIFVAALSLILTETDVSKKKSVFRKILFFVLAAIACTFHFEAAIYLVFVFLMMFLPEKYGKLYVLSGTTVVFLLIETGLLPQIVSRFNTRISYWLTGRTGIGIIIPIFITLLIWCAIQVAGKYCLRMSSKSKTDTQFYSKLLRLSDFIFLLIPLFCYDITFNRLWRIFLIVLYAMVARIFPYKISTNIRQIIVFLIVVLLVALVFYENEFSLLYDILKNNAIFGNFAVF